MTDKQITQQIDKYLKNKTGDDAVLRLCRKQKNIIDAITVAVLSCDETNTMHSHQCRVGYRRLERFLNKCLRVTREIDKARDFESLYRIIEECKIKKVGRLTFYDITHRIGRFKKIKPDRVYLHAGTRKGAEMLHGKIHGDTILKIQLRPPFHRNDIDEEDIEDILCHYIWKERRQFGYV